MERIVIATKDGGTGAGAQHGGAGREANLIFVLPPNLYVGGGFLVSNLRSVVLTVRSNFERAAATLSPQLRRGL
jgi:hypothetical protein